jgi:dTMP kinase
MFLASHIQNWETLVRPALLAGKVVLSDRWWYSQAAYQTQRKVPQSVRVAYRDCCGGPADLLLFLSTDVSVALERARARKDETHQDKKIWNDLGQQERIQEEYYRQFNKNKEWRRIDAEGLDAEQVFAKVQRAIWEELGL